MVNNFFEYFYENFKKDPEKKAIIFNPEGEVEVYTFRDVYKNVAKIQKQILKSGVKKDSKVLMLCEPGPEFYFFTMALVATGASPIFIEAKKEGIIKRLRTTPSEFVLFSEKTKKLKLLLPFFWLKRSFIFGEKGLFLKKINLNHETKDTDVIIEKMKETDPLLISFTTGSTGNPKAADRNYFVSYNQHETSLKYWTHTDHDVDLTFFPNILFQNLFSGVTTLVPKMLVKDLDEIPFEKFNDIIKEHKVTRISAPPGYAQKLCQSINKPLRQIKKIIVGGAPVDKRLSKSILNAFPESESLVVYGSTEAEPISSKNLNELITSTEDGFLVGKAIDEIEILINDPKSSDIKPVNTGEVLISGKHVVQRYLNSEVDNKAFKIKDNKGIIWHKTGDLGYLNESDELILLGRKNHSLKTKTEIKTSLFLENQFNQTLPNHSRCAVFELNNKPYLIIDGLSLSSETDEKAKAFMSNYFESFEIKFIEKIPVDFRHHWKIDYVKLKEQLT